MNNADLVILIVLFFITSVVGVVTGSNSLITVPVIAYVFATEGATVATIAFGIYTFVAGLADNVLKPLLLGRGLDVPMPVILIGAIGGMITGATMGMKMADTSTKIVPGHGPLGDLASLTRYRDMLVTVRDRITKLKKSGQTVQQVVAAAPTKDLDATWGKGFMSPADFLAHALLW